MTPKRVQRRRVKGWKKPDNMVIVDRSSKWGNPYNWRGNVAPEFTVANREEAISRFKEFLLNNQRLLALLPTLKGKNLACTCKLDEECHSDFLLQIANK